MFGAPSCHLCRIEHSCRFDLNTALPQALSAASRVRRAVTRTGLDVPDRLFRLAWRLLLLQLGWPYHFHALRFAQDLEEVTAAVFGLSALRPAPGDRLLCLGSGLAAQLGLELVGTSGESVGDAACPGDRRLATAAGGVVRPMSLSRAAAWDGVLVYRRVSAEDLGIWASKLSDGGRLVAWGRWDRAAELWERRGELITRRHVSAPAAGGCMSPASLSALCLRTLVLDADLLGDVERPGRREAALRELFGRLATDVSDKEWAAVLEGPADAHCPESDPDTLAALIQERRRSLIASGRPIPADRRLELPLRAAPTWTAAQELTTAAARLISDVEALRRCLPSKMTAHRLDAAARRLATNARTGLTRWDNCPLSNDLLSALRCDLRECLMSPVAEQLLKSVIALSQLFRSLPRHYCGFEWNGMDAELLREELQRLDAQIPDMVKSKEEEERLTEARLLEDVWTITDTVKSEEEEWTIIQRACDPHALLKLTLQRACSDDIDWECLLTEIDVREVFG